MQHVSLAVVCADRCLERPLVGVTVCHVEGGRTPDMSQRSQVICTKKEG
jgi:hypothetical protein